jgi:hypothetical protein
MKNIINIIKIKLSDIYQNISYFRYFDIFQNIVIFSNPDWQRRRIVVHDKSIRRAWQFELSFTVINLLLTTNRNKFQFRSPCIRSGHSFIDLLVTILEPIVSQLLHLLPILEFLLLIGLR